MGRGEARYKLVLDNQEFVNKAAQTGSVVRSMQGYLDQLSGAKATASMQALEQAIQKMGGVGALSASQLKIVTAEMQRLEAAGAKASHDLHALTEHLGGIGHAAQHVAGEGVQHLTGHLGGLGSALAVVGPAGLGAAAALGGVALVGEHIAEGLKSAIEKTVAAGTAIDIMASKYQVSTTAVQDFARAGSMVGVSMESIGGGLQKMQRHIVENSAAFRQMGLDAGKLKTMLPEDALRVVAERIASMKNPMEQTAAAYAAFGKTGAELLPFLKALGESSDLGKLNNMSAEQIKTAHELEDALKILKQSWEAVTLQFGSAMIEGGGLKEIVDELQGAILKLNSFVREHKDDIKLIFKVGTDAVSVLITDVGALLTKLERVAAIMPHNASEGAQRGAAFGVGGMVAGAFVGQVMEESGADLPRSLREMSDAKRAAQNDAMLRMIRARGGFKGYVGAPIAGGEEMRRGFEEMMRGVRPPEKPEKTHGFDIAGDKSREVATQMAIKLEEEYQKAVAETAVGLEAVIAKIHATTEAKLAEINANKELTAGDKERLAEGLAIVEQAQIEAAKRAAARKTEAEVQQDLIEADKMMNEVRQAGMSALDVEIQKIEAERQAKVNSAYASLSLAQAEDRDTEAKRKSTNARVLAVNAVAQSQTALAEHNAQLKVESASLAAVNKAEEEYAAMVARGNDSIAARIRQIEAKKKAEIDAAAAQLASHQITTEAYDRVVNAAEAKAGLSIVRAMNEQAVRRAQELRGVILGVADALQIVGVSAHSALGGISALASAAARGDLKGGLQAGLELSRRHDAVGGYARFFTGGGLLGTVGGLLGGNKPQAKEGATNTGFAGIDSLLSTLKNVHHTAAQVGEAFDKAFGDIAANAIDKTTGLLSREAEQLIASAKAAGIHSQAIQSLMAGQAQAAAGNLTAGLAGMKGLRERAAAEAGNAAERQERARLKDSGLSDEEINARAHRAGSQAAGQAASGAGIVSQGAAFAMGGAIAADFAAMQANGMSAAEALKAIGPAVAAMREELKAAGFEGGAAFDALNHQIEIVTGDITGPLVSGITGFSGALVNMSNMGMLTQDMFRGITDQIGANITALAQQGVTGPAAIAALHVPLQQVWELEQKYHFEADAATQALIDQGVAAGTIGPKAKPASEQMIDAMHGIEDAVQRVADALAGVVGKVRELEGTHNVKLNYSETGSPNGGVPTGGVTTSGGGNELPGEALGGVFDSRGAVRGFATGFVGKSGGGGIAKDPTPGVVGKEPVVIGEAGTEVVTPVKALYGSVGKVIAEDSGMSAALEKMDTVAAKVTQLATAVAALADRPAQSVNVSVDNSPKVVVEDNSIVRTRDSQEAFSNFVRQDITRALRQNTGGLRAQIESIIRDIVGGKG